MLCSGGANREGYGRIGIKLVLFDDVMQHPECGWNGRRADISSALPLSKSIGI